MTRRECKVTECTYVHYAVGLCRRHHRWLRKYGSPELIDELEPVRWVGNTVGRIHPAPHVRFFERVEITGFCWNWTGGTSTAYGVFWFGGRMVRAHRWAYEHLVGPIPEGMQLDHLCWNPGCVNPDHLEPVTQDENNARRRRVGRIAA